MWSSWKDVVGRLGYKRGVTSRSLKQTDEYLHGRVGLKHESVPLKYENGQVTSATLTTHPSKHLVPAALDVGTTRSGARQYAVVKEESFAAYTARLEDGHIVQKGSAAVYQHIHDNPDKFIEVIKEDRSTKSVQLKDIYEPAIEQASPFSLKTDAIAALNNNVVSSNLPQSTNNVVSSNLSTPNSGSFGGNI